MAVLSVTSYVTVIILVNYNAKKANITRLYANPISAVKVLIKYSNKCLSIDFSGYGTVEPTNN